jgi:hypothetical protein
LHPSRSPRLATPLPAQASADAAAVATAPRVAASARARGPAGAPRMSAAQGAQRAALLLPWRRGAGALQESGCSTLWHTCARAHATVSDVAARAGEN